MSVFQFTVKPFLKRNGAQELLASQPRCRAMESLIALVKLPCGQANTSRRGFGELLL